MPVCPRCGHHLVRTHRTALQKLLYSDTFRCTSCRLRVRNLHRIFNLNFAFYTSRYTHCIRCGTPRVERLAKRDRIDSLSHHPASALFHITGAPLKRCPSCRLQYYDWRPPVPEYRDVSVRAANDSDG
jgi:hypothetical protein